MMKRLPCFTLILAILCTGITPTHASNRQNPLLALGFNQCDLGPCFLEIVPGKTSWQTASAKLLNHNFRKDTSDLFFSKEEPIQGGIYVDRVPDNPNVVNSVSVSDLSEKYKITLSDVLELYGLPCSVGSDFKGSFWFAYPNILVNALSDGERSSAKASVVFLELVDPKLAISTSGFTVCDETEYSTEYILWFTF